MGEALIFLSGDAGGQIDADRNFEVRVRNFTEKERRRGAPTKA